MKKKRITWKWIGKDEFIPGVPARDMDDEEVDRRGIRKLVELSPKFKKSAQSVKTGDDSEMEE